MLTLRVEGMTCSHCSRAVTQAIQAIDHEAKVNVDLGQGLVNIQSKAARPSLEAAIEESGYTVVDAASSAHH